MKIKPEDLDKISNRIKSQIQLREDASRVRITVHMGTCGIASGAREIIKTFLELKEQEQADDVTITTSGCAGLCSHEPMATVQLLDQAPVKYAKLTPDKVKTIFKDHIQGGKIVKDYALAKGSERVL